MLCNKEDTWTISVDLTEAYPHIPMHPSAWIFLRFVVRSRVYEFRALPFDLFPTPYLCSHLLHVFTGDATNMTQPIKGWLCVGVHGQILTKIVPLNQYHYRLLKHQLYLLPILLFSFPMYLPQRLCMLSIFVLCYHYQKVQQYMFLSY